MMEDDSGPYNAWSWAHAEYSPCSYFEGQDWYLRQRAYVMWGQTRLTGWGLLQSPRADVPAAVIDQVMLSSATFREEKDTYMERVEVWYRGGRGWWSPGDESQVLWPRMKEDRRDSWDMMNGVPYNPTEHWKRKYW